MPAKSNPTVSTGSIDITDRGSAGDDTKAFPTSERGGQTEAGRSVKAEYEALIRAAAPDAKPESVLSVSFANDTVKVEYVDRTQVSEFEPEPIRIATTKIK